MLKKATRAVGHYLRLTDKWLLFLCISCSVFSVILLTGLYNSGLSNGQKIKVQILATGIGLVAAIIISKFDYHFMARMWKLHVPIAYFLVILTFFIGAQRVQGVDDKAWLILPFGLSFQPSELLKISFALSFAYHLNHVKDDINSLKNVLLLCIHGAIPVLLIHFQGDDGTALVFASMFICMIFAAGLSWKYIATAVGTCLVALPILWFKVLSYDQKMRIMVVFDPTIDLQGIAHQQQSSILSIGSGQVWGSGVFSGNHRYIAEIYNDMIFAFIGEAMGFVGCVLVIALLGSICVKILNTSRMAIDPLGKYICVGIFAMFATQSIINIGMCIGVLPIIGITLPFFSAGGTSVVTLYMGIGVALSVYMNSRKNLFLDK